MQGGRSVFLLVEDNADDVFFMQRAFKRAGLLNPLQVVTNGDQAIDYLAGNREFGDRTRYPFPHMIFLDLKLPGRDGFDVLTWLRQERKSDVPVAVLTSSPEEVDRTRARLLGAEAYLLKPPTKEVLIDTCRQFSLDCG